MWQGQDGGTGLKGTQARKGEGRCLERAPSRCTRTCCKAARPTPWPPTPHSSRSCQSLSAGQSGCDSRHFRRSSTSALGFLFSHPQLGCLLGGLAPLLGRLLLRVRRPRDGCNWPGVTVRDYGLCKLVARRG